MRKASLMPILAAVMVAAIFAILVSAKPDTALLRQKLVADGLERLGHNGASWRTLVILSSREIDVPPAVAFKAWANPAIWPGWGRPLILDAHWLVGQDQAMAPLTLPADRRWSTGSRFEETLDLGFPLAHLSQTNRVEAVKPGSEISWRNETGSLDSYQTWSFEPLPDGGTRITVVQIFDGVAIGLGRYMVQDRWQQRFDEAIDGLVLEALRQSH
jgi:uncharacterized protein YndB with AHSA1/START domain